MTMSSGRNVKSFQTVELKWWLWSSRVFRGHPLRVNVHFASPLVQIDAA